MNTDTQRPAAQVAEKWFKLSDRSKFRFFNLINEAARGTGITNRSDLKKITALIRRKAKELGVIPTVS